MEGPDGLLSQMSWEQFRGWLAYSQIEPFGEERGDLRAGIVASVIANVNRDPKKGKAFQAKDFMPRFGEDESSSVRSSRRPVTDADEWKRNMNKARLFAQALAARKQMKPQD